MLAFTVAPMTKDELVAAWSKMQALPERTMIFTGWRYDESAKDIRGDPVDWLGHMQRIDGEVELVLPAKTEFFRTGGLANFPPLDTSCPLGRPVEVYTIQVMQPKANPDRDTAADIPPSSPVSAT
jgi:hypothetical protein